MKKGNPDGNSLVKIVGDLIYGITGREIDDEILINYINKAIKDGVSDRKPRNIADWILTEFEHEDMEQENPSKKIPQKLTDEIVLILKNKYQLDAPKLDKKYQDVVIHFIALAYVGRKMRDAKKIADFVINRSGILNRENPIGPGYHDVTMEYKLGGKDYAQKFLNVKAISKTEAEQKAIGALEKMIGTKVGFSRLGVESGKYTKYNPKANWKNGSVLQSILFDKGFWTKTQARRYLMDAGFLYGHMDEMPNFWAFRQYDPKDIVKDHYATVKNKFGKGIDAKFGEPK